MASTAPAAAATPSSDGGGSSTSTATSKAGMPMRELGSTGIMVSRVCLGTWQFGDTSGTFTVQDEETQLAIVKAALEAGINFFDTAEGYGNGVSERALGKYLKALEVPRSKVVIASKVLPSNCTSGKTIVEACDRSLKNLGMEYIDLYQVHWPNHDVAFKETLEAMQGLVDAGKVKAIGVSNFGKLDTADAAATGIPFVTNQLPYSLLARCIEYSIVDVCKAHDVGILAYSPLAQGLLAGKYKDVDSCHDGISRSRLFKAGRSSKCRHHGEGCEAEMFACIDGMRELATKHNLSMVQLAVGWLLAQEAVTSVVFGASKASHIASNVAVATSPLDKTLVEELTQLSEPVKKALGSCPDLWDDESVGRYR